MTTSLHITGNIVPDTWIQRLVHEKSRKPYWLAVWVLSDVCYWYSPTEVRDEKTGAVKGYAKKYKGDLLQRSYADIMARTACEKKEAQRACKFLADNGLVKLHFRTITIGGVKCSNVMFIEPKIEAVKSLTYSEVWNSVGEAMDTDVHSYEHACSEGMDADVHTNTVTTTKTNPESVGQAPRPHAPATADDLMPAHLRGWIENNQPATGELLNTDQALAQLEANAPYKAAIIQASRDKRETGRNSAPLREAAQRARELGFMPEQILAAFSMADGSYWRSTSFGRNGERPYVSNICQMIDEAAGNKPLTGDELGAYNLLLRVKARSLQPHELNRPELNGAGKLALAVAKRNHGLPWLDNATPEAIRAAVAGVQS